MQAYGALFRHPRLDRGPRVVAFAFFCHSRRLSSTLVIEDLIGNPESSGFFPLTPALSHEGERGNRERPIRALFVSLPDSGCRRLFS